MEAIQPDHFRPHKQAPNTHAHAHPHDHLVELCHSSTNFAQLAQKLPDDKSGSLDAGGIKDQD